MGILLALPIWIGPFFPTQDGPVYLYNAWVFHSLQDSTNVLMQASFSPNIVLYAFPNFCLMQLMLWLTPLIAEKCMYSLIAIGWLSSLILLCRACGVKHWLVLFLSALWVFNEFMMLGMVNFCLAQIFWLLATAVWVRYRSELLLLHAMPVILFSLLAIAALLLHPFVALPLVVMLLMTLVGQFIYLGLSQHSNNAITANNWALNTPISRWMPWLSHSVVSSVWLILWVCVLLTLVSIYQGSTQESMDIGLTSWEARWHFWFGAQPLGYFSESHMTLGLLSMWVFMLFGFARGMAECLILWRSHSTQSWMTRLNAVVSNPLALVSLTGLVLMVVGFSLPWSINNVGFMYKRCFWVAWVCLLPVVFQTFLKCYQSLNSRLYRIGFAIVIVSMPLAYPLSLTWQCTQFNHELTRILETTKALPPHRRIHVIAGDKYTSTRLGALSLVSPFYHIDSYVGLQQPDRVTSDTFGHGRYNLVWLNFPRIDDRTLDAILIFRQPYTRTAKLSSAFYPAQINTDDTQLFLKMPHHYRLQNTDAVVNALKNRQPILLGCSPQSVLTHADVFHVLHQFPQLQRAQRATLTSTTFERDSGWGWLASSLGVMDDNRQSLGVNAKRWHPPHAIKYPYTQWGRQPAHLMLPLAPGRYRIVWWMYTVRSIPIQLTLSANGETIAKHLLLKPNALNTLSYGVTVGDQGLLQTLSGESGSPWALSGMAILPQ